MPRFKGHEAGYLQDTVRETSKAVQSLFDRPSKNMLWSVGYGLGGVLLIPIIPIAVGAFCMAGVHLVSASYQFLHDKPEAAAGNEESTSTEQGENAEKGRKSLSLDA